MTSAAGEKDWIRMVGRCIKSIEVGNFEENPIEGITTVFNPEQEIAFLMNGRKISEARLGELNNKPEKSDLFER